MYIKYVRVGIYIYRRYIYIYIYTYHTHMYIKYKLVGSRRAPAMRCRAGHVFAHEVVFGKAYAH